MPTIAAVLLGTLLAFALVIALAWVPVRRILRQDTVTRPWLGLGEWWQAPPEAEALEWIRLIQPRGVTSVGSLPHGDEITVTMHGRHRGFALAAHQWTWRELGLRRPRRENRTAVAVILPRSVPSLEIRHGASGSDLSLGWPPFDEAFRLRCDDPSFARALLTPPVAQWLLEDPRSPFFPVCFVGNLAATVEFGRMFVPQLGPPADFLAELLSRAPRDLWQG